MIRLEIYEARKGLSLRKQWRWRVVAAFQGIFGAAVICNAALPPGAALEARNLIKANMASKGITLP